MPAKTLEDLFHQALKDMYSVERKLLRSLPKMAKGARDQELAAAFERHRDRTEIQLQRLEIIFAIAGKPAKGGNWSPGDGLIDEGLDLLQHYKASPALDAGLFAVVQAVAHYELTRYAALKRWADALGMKAAAKLLTQSVSDEALASATLSMLAGRTLPVEAVREAPAAEAAPTALIPQAA